MQQPDIYEEIFGVILNCSCFLPLIIFAVLVLVSDKKKPKE